MPPYTMGERDQKGLHSFPSVGGLALTSLRTGVEIWCFLGLDPTPYAHAGKLEDSSQVRKNSGILGSAVSIEKKVQWSLLLGQPLTRNRRSKSLRDLPITNLELLASARGQLSQIEIKLNASIREEFGFREFRSSTEPNIRENSFETSEEVPLTPSFDAAGRCNRGPCSRKSS
ncbi:hypothetical protein AJ78_01513 [Emergomyces pasteurianus Ep9510]|uniref:Uncharacterized protein n=1 Tax=Emergomyces pasteurianus Ep9510 TaxID=1447872 RepID=A0A1J9PPV0_9EURO|nr:hypothetical protein AJ78_01513 [Emergomyces pasteurianus Ep9510]